MFSNSQKPHTVWIRRTISLGKLTFIPCHLEMALRGRKARRVRSAFREAIGDFVEPVPFLGAALQFSLSISYTSVTRLTCQSSNSRNYRSNSCSWYYQYIGTYSKWRVIGQDWVPRPYRHDEYVQDCPYVSKVLVESQCHPLKQHFDDKHGSENIVEDEESKFQIWTLFEVNIFERIPR